MTLFHTESTTTDLRSVERIAKAGKGREHPSQGENYS